MPPDTTTEPDVLAALTFMVRKPMWLTSNRHSTNLPARNRTVQDLHRVAGWYAAAAHTGPLAGPVRLAWMIHYPKGTGWQHGDAANAQPTTKALLDGLVEAGVLDGDGPRTVTHESFTRGPNLDVAMVHHVGLAILPGVLAEWVKL